ncbi:MAG TPA: Ig-like domain-containing protein, partial [Candidatus Saccharimonadales bacterium]|nr:Ig-like domain-containing protein [Candidatus Saccharimonadales bacterium]
MSTDRRSLAALCLVLAAGAALGAGGCGSSSTAPAARAVSLTLSPDSAVITPGNQIAFHASARDSRGQPVSVTVHWAVGDTHVVAVDSAGVVVGRNEGRTTVEARTPTLRAVGTVRVIHTGSGVGQITVTPDPARYIAGDIQPFAAEVRDSAGGVLLMAVQWSVDHPAVAAVDSAGTVTCLAPGSAVVTAAAAGVRGTAQLTVVAAPQVSTAAGNGTPGTQDGAAAQASFNTPMGLAVDSLGAVYVADLGNNRIRVLENGQVRTLAGGSPGYADGVGTAASFLSPTGVAVGPGRRLYVADQGNHAIRRVDPDGTVTTVAGQPPYPGYLDSVPSEAMFRDPSGVAVTSAGHIFVADRGNSVIREVVPGDQVRTVCGTPGVPGFEDGTPGFMDEPFGLALGPDGTLYVCERGEGSSAVCRVSAQGALATLAGSGHPGSRGGPGPFG